MRQFGVIFEFNCPGGHTYRAAKVYRLAKSEDDAARLFSMDTHACGQCSAPWRAKVSAGVYPFELDDKMRAYLAWKGTSVTTR